MPCGCRADQNNILASSAAFAADSNAQGARGLSVAAADITSRSCFPIRAINLSNSLAPRAAPELPERANSTWPWGGVSSFPASFACTASLIVAHAIGSTTNARYRLSLVNPYPNFFTTIEARFDRCIFSSPRRQMNEVRAGVVCALIRPLATINLSVLRSSM